MPKPAKIAPVTWPRSAASLGKLLSELDERRGQVVRQNRKERGPRPSLSQTRRQEILDGAGGLCHLCGGRIRGNRFVVDHVASFASGGPSKKTNYLPAHRECNGYKWFFLPRELRWMLRMSVWARHRMTDGTGFGGEVLDDFWKWEKRRRRRSSDKDLA